MKAIQDFKQIFDKKLEAFFRSKRKRLERDSDDKLILLAFEQAMQITQSGGKRLRPYLAWLMYQACGGKERNDIWDVLIGIELFHAFALIHDDIMDRGTLRHGLPTVHVTVEQALKKDRRIGDVSFISLSQAILVGDLFYAWSTELVAKGGAQVLKVFFEMNQEVMLGQMLDVDGMSRLSLSSHQLMQKTNKKTAGYTFVQPLRMGYALAGSPTILKTFPEAFGRPLGIAFQIQDDYLDLTGTEKQLGKQPFSDIRDGQHTYFTHFLQQYGSKKHQQRLQKVFRTRVTQKDAKEILLLFTESGAIERGIHEMNRLFQRSLTSLEKVKMPSVYKEAFQKLYEIIHSRTH